MERCPSAAFAAGLGPTRKEEVVTNLHLKCCPARPPAYAAFRFLQTNPSARDSCMAFTKARLLLVSWPSRKREGPRPRLETRGQDVRNGFRRVESAGQFRLC